MPSLFGMSKRDKDKYKERETVVVGLEKERNELVAELQQARVQMGILEGDKAIREVSGTYTGRDQVIEEVAKKYNGTALWGNEFVRMIATTRSAFALAGGIDAQSEEDEKESLEVEFIKDFIDFNGLNGANCQDLGKEKSLEGTLLLVLEWVKDPGSLFGGHVRVTHVPYIQTSYKLEYVDGWPERGLLSASWREEGSNKDTVVPDWKGEVFRFNARTYEKYGWPDVQGCIGALDRISKNLEYWRAMNWLYANPTPYFRTQNRQESEELYSWLTGKTINWKIGKMIAAEADLSFLGGNSGDWNSVKQEIITDIQVVSATCGTPVQFFGHPELMSNRATAENTMEPVAVVALSEQQVWQEGFDKVFNKAIGVYNNEVENGSRLLRPGIVKTKLSFVTQQQLSLVEQLFFPMWQEGAMSLDTLLGFIPNIQADEELIKIEAEKAKKDEKLDELAQRYVKDKNANTEEDRTKNTDEP